MDAVQDVARAGVLLNVASGTFLSRIWVTGPADPAPLSRARGVWTSVFQDRPFRSSISRLRCRTIRASDYVAAIMSRFTIGHHVSRHPSFLVHMMSSGWDRPWYRRVHTLYNHHVDIIYYGNVLDMPVFTFTPCAFT